MRGGRGPGPHRSLARDRHTGALDEFNDAARCAGHKERLAVTHRQAADVGGVEAIHILRNTPTAAIHWNPRLGAQAAGRLLQALSRTCLEPWDPRVTSRVTALQAVSGCAAKTFGVTGTPRTGATRIATAAPSRLLYADGVQDVFLVDVLWHRQLHHEAMHRRIGVERLHHLPVRRRRQRHRSDAGVAPPPALRLNASAAYLGVGQCAVRTARTSSSVAVSGIFAPNEAIPTSAQAFFLLRTYVSESCAATRANHD